MITQSLYLLFVLLISVIHAQSTLISPRMDFQSPKKIGFSAVGGGSTHYHWVLEILQEMKVRGHEATLYTRSDSIRFAKDYPEIQTQIVGGDLNFLAAKNKRIGPNNHLQHENYNPSRFIYNVVPSLLSNYSNEYLEFETIIKEQKLDIMLCDLFALACMDASVKARIPLVVTSTMTYTPDTSNGYVTNFIPSFGHPTTETMTLWERLRHHFYTWYVPFKTCRLNLPAHAFQKAHGIPLTCQMYNSYTKGAFKLLNNMFGIEAARTMGPLTELIGPILRPHYTNLSPELASFLKEHQRVGYVAFGQHAVPTIQDTTFLVQALLDQLDQGTLDGILWATTEHHPIPPFNTTTTTTTTTNSNSNSSFSNILVTGWTPQFAVLQHPSTALFITHGGTGSIHEGIISKVPLFVYPFFGDQPITARMIRRQKIGDALDTAGMKYTDATLAELSFRINKVLTDPVIQKTVKHYGHTAQIRSVHAVQRGADLLEEIMFGSVDGKILHRIDVGDEISWYKRTNLDLILFILLGLVGVIGLVRRLTRWLKLSQKLKTL